jgi:DNA-damage-inducible protein J
MGSKTASVHARIQPTLKVQAEAVLDKLGISTSEAIAIFFSQIALQKGLPFEVKIPNKTTRKAMQEAGSGRSKKFSNVADLMDELNTKRSL